MIGTTERIKQPEERIVARCTRRHEREEEAIKEEGSRPFHLYYLVNFFFGSAAIARR